MTSEISIFMFIALIVGMLEGTRRFLCGYNELEDIDKELFIPNDTTHIIIIKGIEEIKARKYYSLYKFKSIYFDRIILAYNSNTKKIHDNLCSSFYNIELEEFVHLVLPNEPVKIDYIPVDSYVKGVFNPIKTLSLNYEVKYMCECKDDVYVCEFHRFLIENLFYKYKNVNSKNTSCNNDSYNDRSMV